MAGMSVHQFGKLSPPGQQLSHCPRRTLRNLFNIPQLMLTTLYKCQSIIELNSFISIFFLKSQRSWISKSVA